MDRKERHDRAGRSGGAAGRLRDGAHRLGQDRPGISQAERERDENACLRAAIGTHSGGELLAPYCIDRDVYTRGMETRGYTVRSK
jgi:hypothetical protein